MDLALRVDIDTTEKEDESADGEDSSRYYLQVVFHKLNTFNFWSFGFIELRKRAYTRLARTFISFDDAKVV